MFNFIKNLVITKKQYWFTNSFTIHIGVQFFIIGVMFVSIDIPVIASACILLFMFLAVMASINMNFYWENKDNER